ncbi:MAG: type III-B CRISPR module-associated protein Cmr5 [Saprospiraceae bacterium]|nr:type III-B CRISPR module-associated protein Cmr5 [Saprospiraceae bacterium]
MEPNTRQQLEQGRANTAYMRVMEFKDSNPGKSTLDEYKSYSKKFPMMVKTNGLGSALAFIKSKQKRAYNRIYEDLTEWLAKDNKKIVDLSSGTLLEIVVSMDDSANYRSLTNEVLAYMNWHRRFTEALLEK